MLKYWTLSLLMATLCTLPAPAQPEKLDLQVGSDGTNWITGEIDQQKVTLSHLFRLSNTDRARRSAAYGAGGLFGALIGAIAACSGGTCDGATTNTVTAILFRPDGCTDLPANKDKDRQLATLKAALDQELITPTEFTTLGQATLKSEPPKTCLLQSSLASITLPEGMTPSQGKFTIEYQLNPMTTRYMTFKIHPKGSPNYEAQLLKQD